MLQMHRVTVGEQHPHLNEGNSPLCRWSQTSLT